MKPQSIFFGVTLSFLALAFSSLTSSHTEAQQPPQTPASGAAAVQKGIQLSDQGRCLEALPLLRKYTSLTQDKATKLKAGLATVRCAMTTDHTEAALDAIRMLNREYPTDPDVLYVTVHAYSDLSTRASLALIRVAPDSYQALQLNADSLESQGKWEEAAKEYRAILAKDPNLPGIHFRIARCVLSKQENFKAGGEAQKELEAELRIDPNNAAAEYILGQLAQQVNDWETVIAHYSRAVKISPNFAEAQLGLGMALMANDKYEQAITPLQIYTKIQPANPAGHYQLMMAYSRTGRKEEAVKEAALQRQAAEQIEAEKQRNRGVAPAQPPQ